jgi:hypothetical protein
VVLEDVVLPEFSKSLQIYKLLAYVFDAPDCHYDVIVGCNFILPNNFDIKFSTRQMEMFHFDFDDDADEEDPFDVFAADILLSKYEHVDVDSGTTTRSS